MSAAETQPRYAAYSAANGRSVEEQAAHDEAAFPGGRMTGFIVWIGQRWLEFDATFGKRIVRDAAVHAEFDAWLSGPAS